ncbi:MAG: F0F1 ATP synthase subunit A [Myxococcota bacterium]|nr:F0F1 ATP synthase subunit A [Myxococcota bacterium]
MPHGESWFTLFFRGTFLWDSVVALVMAINGVTGEPDSLLADETGYVGHVFSALFILLVLATFAFVSFQKVKATQDAIVPEAKLTIRTFVELLVGAAYSLMSDIMGPKPARFFLPLIGTAAFFILFSNVLGLVPGFTPPTDNLNTTLALALVVFVATHYYGIKENGFNHVKHLFGPVVFDPKRPITILAIPLMLLMFFIEVISHIARPISLSIRLMANMVADHLVVGAFLSIIAFVLPVPVMVLGTLVVVVQTLVFCVLSTVYIGLAIQHDESH